MKLAIRMQTRFSLTPAVLATLVLAGCASTVTAPVRDGSGAVSTPVSEPTAQAGVHVVKPGDTLLGIARQYGVTLPDLVGWNNLTDPNQIQVGRALRMAVELDPRMAGVMPSTKGCL